MLKEKMSNAAFILVLFFNGVCEAKKSDFILPATNDSSISKLSSQDWSEIKYQMEVSHNSEHLTLNQTVSKDIDISLLRQSAYVKASNTDARDLFGYSVAVWGNTAVVSAFNEDSDGENGDSNNLIVNSGAAYVFVKSGNTWKQEAILKASNPNNGDTFGVDVAIHNNTIVVGADWEDSDSNTINGDQSDNNAEDSGAVYVFVREGQQWHQQAYLKASNSDTNDVFGRSVDIFEDTIVVGARTEDSNANSINGDQSDNSSENSGAAYIFARSGKKWQQQAYLKASNAEAMDLFGFSVAIDNGTVVVSAVGEDSNATGVNGDQSNNAVEFTGALYTFIQQDGNWVQEAYIKASNPDAEDLFGFSVDISGDTIVVGAEREDSNASGVNGNQANNSFSNAGAVYVFERSNGNWLQTAYLKPQFIDVFDSFGWSVSIDKNTILIGAIRENGSTEGINGDASLNDLSDSGAVYMFIRQADLWTQHAYLKSSEVDRGDSFGQSVAISNQVIVVGSALEDSSSMGINQENNNLVENSGAAYIFDTGDFSMDAAHSALWFNRDQNGHGINVYMLPDNRMVAIWYVYDDMGNPLWLLGVGDHNGFEATLDVTIAEGGMFPPNFDSDDVDFTNWGQFKLKFSDCDNGLFEWMPVPDNGFDAGQMDIVRLNNTVGLDCSESDIQSNKDLTQSSSVINGVSGITAEHSALWFNRDQNGHGINLYMLPDDRALVIWYVYDDSGLPLWLLGVGTHDGQKAVFDVSVTSGAMFPPDFNSDDVQLNDWGQFELEFSDCDNGFFSWIPNDDNGFTPGKMTIERLNKTLGLNCIDSNQ